MWKLEAKARQVSGKQNKKIRRESLIPAVVYGHDFKPVNIAISYHDFERVYAGAGESSLLDLTIDKKKPITVIIQEVQTDPRRDQFIHVDFHQVKMTEKITTDVALKYIGEAKAVKDLGGVLFKNLDKIKIECLAGDLIQEVEVDISALNTFDDIIYVRDLKLPEKIKLLEKTDEVIAKVAPPRSDEELKALEEEVHEEVEEVEGVKKEEPTEEAGEEGKGEGQAKTAEKEAGQETATKKT